MRNRLIALALLAAVIVALVLLYRHHSSRPRPAAVPLTTLAPAALTRIVVKARGGSGFVLVHTGGGWRMQKPVDVRADADRVDALLEGLGEATTRHYSLHALSLADVGLSPPAFTLETGGVRLEFGALNPANLLRYVRRGDTVYLVFDTIEPRLAAGPWQFVDRRLLPPGSRITHIASTLPGAGNAMQSARAWLGAKAIEVKPLAEGAANNAPTIAVSLASRRRPLVFALLARRPQPELARPDLGIVYVLGAALADKLLGPTPATAGAHAGTAGSRNGPPRP